MAGNPLAHVGVVPTTVRVIRDRSESSTIAIRRKPRKYSVVRL
jgi:hypothetical protein